MSVRWKYAGIAAASIITFAAGIGIAMADTQTPSTFGVVPEEAYGKDGSINLDKVPDFVVALDRAGNPVGYVAKEEVFSPPGDSAGETVVNRDQSPIGRMVPGYGFVKAGTDIATFTPFDVTAGPVSER